MRISGLDPEVLADLRAREQSAGDRTRHRKARNPWAPDVDPPVEHWPCRGGCGRMIGVGQEAVTALAIMNARLVVERKEAISKAKVMWCPACKKRDDDLAALQRRPHEQREMPLDNPNRRRHPCCLGSACLNPHPYHLASECFDLEMAKATHERSSGMPTGARKRGSR